MRQPDLGQQSLDTLAGVSDEGAADEALGGTRVACDPDHLGCLIQAAAVEDRSPVPPEQVAMVGCSDLVAGHGSEVAGQIGQRSVIEYGRGRAPGST